MNRVEYVSKITILCKDGSKRVITVIGRWGQSQAVRFGQDLDRENYYSASVSIY